MSETLQRQGGSTEADIVVNPSRHPSMQEVVTARLSRRDVLKGSLGAAALGFIGASATVVPEAAQAQLADRPQLRFAAVAKNLLDQVTVPDGYVVDVLYRLGDPIAAGIAPYANDGTDADADQRAGDHHDGMSYFGLSDAGTYDPTRSDRGLLCINHENITQLYLHKSGPTTLPNGQRPLTEAVKEQDVHGVSIIEVVRNRSGKARYVQDSPYNRRITTLTPMAISGPARGSAQLATVYDPDGLRTRGTLNNCANGRTPWGTYLTCEENWAFYFRRDAGDDANRTAAEVTALNRYGIAAGASGNYAWSRRAADRFARFNATVTGATPADDYRNEPNNFGWIVESDPFAPNSRPVKRTALGRFSHEGSWFAPVVAGQPVVCYSGDDARGEYVYKFVSEQAWDPADLSGGLAVGNKYMNRGTLYVARFNADGTGAWLPLVHGENGLNASNPVYPFADQADVVIHARLAADLLGATRMDRPEWGAADPVNGDLYFTMTNNSQRGTTHPVDAANPRNYDSGTDGNPDLDGNVNGHIIRLRERARRHHARTFRWDIYLFGARASYPAEVNVSGLTDANDFSSPDGLWFDRRGIIWIQTDDGAYTDTTNCMMLAGLPGRVGDGGPTSIGTQGTFIANESSANERRLRRFLVGPLGCEITGVDMTPDFRTMFVNIQHPGESGDLTTLQSTWPDGGTSRPRSATIVIRRADGSQIASHEE